MIASIPGLENADMIRGRVMRLSTTRWMPGSWITGLR